MAKRVKIELPNDSFFVEFQGDTPTLAEQIKLANVIKSRQAGQGAGQLMSKAQIAAASADAKDEQLFDTTSGIQDAGFRAKLSAAETKGDEEKQLRVLYGMTDNDYLRDSRGRLALTPSGGEKIGVKLTQSTLIDEEDFSRYDIADLAGLAPEITGAVAGGIKGASIGSALGPLGTVAGGALGAGLAAAGGQAIEEAIESKFGVQAQTPEEVRADLEREFLIGGATDLTLGLFGLVARGIGGTMRAGKGLTPDELKTAAESIEMGINPTLSAIRAPSVVARQQGIVEKIFGSSPRLKQNNDVMQKKLADYRSQVENSTDQEAGVLLLEKSKEAAEKALAAQTDAQKAVLNTLRSLGESMGAAAQKNGQLDQEVFDILVGSRKAFDAQVRAAFKPIDEALESNAGSNKIFNINNIRESVDEIKEQNASALAAGTMKELGDAIKAINAMGKDGTVSFMQLYDARKSLNDLLVRVPFSNKTQRRAINDLMRKIDVKLKPENLRATIDNLGVLPKDEVDILMRAAGALDPARNMYSEGAKIFEDIEAAGVIKNLAAKAANNMSMGVKDVDISKIIVNDNPRFLERTLKAVGYGKSDEVKSAAAEGFREQLASEWLNDALSSSGLRAIDDIDPSKFKPGGFKKAVDDLGRTADVLFGDKADEIRSLANQIDKIGLSSLKDSDISAIRQMAGEGAPIINQLRELARAQREIYQNQKNRAFSKLAAGENINPLEAAELIGNNTTSASDIKKILDAFEGDPISLQKIRGNYMERLISDFGDTITTDGKTLGAFAKRLLEADRGGKLSVIFGDEMGKDMAKFARILDFNSRTAAGGDLVAANIAASPIQNLGKLARFTIIGKVLQNGPYYRQIVADYERLAKGLQPKEKSRLLGRLMAQGLSQQSQEGFQEAEEQIQSVMDSSGISEQISQLQQQLPNPNNYSSLGQAAVVPPIAPASPPQQPQGTLRQRAAQSPGIAAALGIQGATAGLI